MTDPGKGAPIRVLHAAGRNDLILFIVPLFLLMPAVILVLSMALPAVSELLGRTGEQQIIAEWWWYLAVVALCALFPFGAHLKARLTTRYTVYPTAIMAEVGFLNRKSSEIRIGDIRNITVTQSLLERLLQIGNVAFSSAAGDREEVVFASVLNPLMLKALVKDLQDIAADGVVDATEQARIDSHRAR
jgi:uncharacterized membrane protein YdbT with pleckstrin-like domain